MNMILQTILPEIKTADSAHTKMLPSVTSPFLHLHMWALVEATLSTQSCPHISLYLLPLTSSHTVNTTKSPQSFTHTSRGKSRYNQSWWTQWVQCVSRYGNGETGHILSHDTTAPVRHLGKLHQEVLDAWKEEINADIYPHTSPKGFTAFPAQSPATTLNVAITGKKSSKWLLLYLLTPVLHWDSPPTSHLAGTPLHLHSHVCVGNVHRVPAQ